MGAGSLIENEDPGRSTSPTRTFLDCPSLSCNFSIILRHATATLYCSSTNLPRWRGLRIRSMPCPMAPITSRSSSFRRKRPWFVCPAVRTRWSADDDIGLCELDDTIGAHVTGLETAVCYRDVGCGRFNGDQVT
jgi:hypothetical protein